MKVFIFSVIIFLSTTFLFSQTSETKYLDNPLAIQPKLVVGIVVDQMRYDYVTRFYNKYGEGGFKRMINEGFTFKNHNFNYIPTYTGPGHASIFTGTTPSIHGIIANDWYDKTIQKSVYCVQDDSINSVGTENNSGKMSPHRMKTTTITDQLRLATQQKSKVIGISLKDRGAILPVGHSGTAYWFLGKEEAKWISSSFYMETLPEWVTDFNTSGVVKSYLQEWNTLYPIQNYSESGPDKTNFEKTFNGKESSVFPYDLKALAPVNGNFDLIKETPFGNSITTDFAIAAIEGENLGANTVTDFLAISYSSTDYIGHTFGINSKEIQDTYLRLDKDLERLFTYLDATLGKNQYTVFLTADHGALQTPAYLQSQHIPAGFFNNSTFEKEVKEYTKQVFKTDNLMENISSNQIFLNYEIMKANNLKAEEVQNRIAEFVLQYPQIDKVFTRHQLDYVHYTDGIGALIQNGFHQKRSGDVIYVLDPATISTWYQDGGTTHGSGFSYDTHVPLLFFGKGIKKGSTYTRTEVIDIAPTLAAFLGIARPNGTTGNVLTELFY